LLEAGPPDKTRREVAIPIAFGKLFRTEMDWIYRTEPEPGLNGRGRVLAARPDPWRQLLDQRDDVHAWQPTRLPRLGEARK